MKEPVSLRSTLATLTILVTLLAVLIAGALVGLTTILHRTTASSSASVESVRLAAEAEIDLLLHERAGDAIVKRDIEGNLRRRLLEARRFVTTVEEARVLAEAEEQVEAYIEASRDPQRSPDERAAKQEVPYGALDGLVAINVAQSKVAQQEAARSNSIGNILGIGVGALLVLLAGGLLFWLRGRAFEPIFALASAMQRFSRGDRDVRAAERGPRELQDMSARFNEMASAIAAQRHAQMAFLGGVAHDLRNPLSVLQLSVALLGRELLGPDKRPVSEERLRQTIERIGRQIIQMERMLGDFLDVVKIEAGELDLRLEAHDARALIEEVVELFGDSQEHKLEVRLPDQAVFTRCDSLRIEQVITNLISNAIKYSPRGSEVEVKLEARGEELSLSVTDHGAGISDDDKARVFEPFRRVGPSKETVPGVGLGLFVVRRIVEAHGGRIELDSRLGLGSTFRIFLSTTLPVVESFPRA